MVLGTRPRDAYNRWVSAGARDMGQSATTSNRFVLERELEQGRWWQGRDRRTGARVVCTIANLDADEHELLDAACVRMRDWPHVARVCGIEERFDGTWLIAYATQRGDRYDRVVDGPLTAREGRELLTALGGTLAGAHRHGTIHPGLTAACVELVIDDAGAMRAHLVGLGLPAWPSRTARDDQRELASIIDGFLTRRGVLEHGAHGVRRTSETTKNEPGLQSVAALFR